MLEPLLGSGQRTSYLLFFYVLVPIVKQMYTSNMPGKDGKVDSIPKQVESIITAFSQFSLNILMQARNMSPDFFKTVFACSIPANM